MSTTRKARRQEERKYKRIFVRYGVEEPRHRAVAMQLSTRGLFLSTNEIVYRKGSPIIVEFTVGDRVHLVSGVVRYDIKVHPNIARFTRPGMGVELIAVPQPVKDYLASL